MLTKAAGVIAPRLPRWILLAAPITLVASLLLATPWGMARGWPQAEEPVFVSRVETAALPNPVPLPQDVLGIVLDRNGRGLSGIWVKVKSEGGWEASAATRGDGSFYFTLSEGRFSVVLVDRVSQPAFFRVDGKTVIRVVFQEVTARTTPTPMAGSPTPLPTLTPSTPPAGPQPTAPPPRPRGTPTPSVTPLSAPAPTLTPLNPSPGPAPSDLFLTSFLVGIALVIAVFLGATALRRRRG